MNTSTLTPAAPDLAPQAIEWTEIGTTVLPARHRAAFTAMLAGIYDGEARPWEWVKPNGMLPMSPGMALETLIAEFRIRPVLAVSHTGMWEYDERTLAPRPGSMGAYVATGSVLGIRTGRQTLVFLDAGCTLTPVCIITGGFAPHWHIARTDDGMRGEYLAATFSTAEDADRAAGLVTTATESFHSARCACTDGERMLSRAPQA